MNIFWLNNDPYLAANDLVDKHVVKMGLESVQMLCTAHRVLDNNQVPENFYKACHINHPCSKWVRENQANYWWLFRHAAAIFGIYSEKSGKIHKSSTLLDQLKYNPKNLPSGDLTEPALCMPDEFKHVSFEWAGMKSYDAVRSYRDFYRVAKAHLHQWTYNNRPTWI